MAETSPKKDIKKIRIEIERIKHPIQYPELKFIENTVI